MTGTKRKRSLSPYIIHPAYYLPRPPPPPCPRSPIRKPIRIRPPHPPPVCPRPTWTPTRWFENPEPQNEVLQFLWFVND